MIEISYLESGRAEVCESILRSLPAWFGIEEATKDYISRSEELPMLVAESEGSAIAFLSLKKHGASTSEVYVMGVLPEFHRNGVGRRLLAEAERELAKQEVEFLQVKTVSASKECDFYSKTIQFYKSCGFKEVEVFPTLWDEGNPCQLLIKTIPSSAAETSKVIISKYSGNWPSQFSEAKNLLLKSIGDLVLSIDHIGSTSVPGLSAKDLIDLQITIEKLDCDFKNTLDEKLEAAGFQKSKMSSDHRPPGDQSEDSEWEKLYIAGGHPSLNFKLNIHVRVLGCKNQKYPILFRDFLREHPKSAKAYEMLKKELSRFHPYNRVAYCEIKDPGCDLVMAHAEEWAERVNWSLVK